MAHFNKSIFTYHEDHATKKLIYEQVGARLFYLGEDFDARKLYKKYISPIHAGVYIIKNGRGRVLSKVEVVEI